LTRSFADSRGWSRLLTHHNRVFVCFHAFGWRFFERRRPRALQEGGVEKWTSQFRPTTAHTTTIHTGLPVSEHGLWHVCDRG
jgi:hypothetical protein